MVRMLIVWQVLANLLALAAVCPFVGSLSDLMGRRYVSILGATILVVGIIVSSTAHSMNIFIGEHHQKQTGEGKPWLTHLRSWHGHSRRRRRYQ